MHAHSRTMCRQICEQPQRCRQDTKQPAVKEKDFVSGDGLTICPVNGCMVCFKKNLYKEEILSACLWSDRSVWLNLSRKALLSIIIQEFSLDMTLQISNTLPVSLNRTLLCA